MPLFDRDQHGSLNAATGHNLRTLFESKFQQLAESSFGVLYLPGSQTEPPFPLLKEYD
jgi:hypothetical protein